MNKPLTWLFPEAAAREYEADLRQFARAITQAVAEVLRLKQDDWRSDMMRILMDLPQQLQKQTEQTALQVAVHAQAVNRFNDTQFHHVVSSAYGQDFYKPEPFLQDALQAWTLENARLIQSIPEQYIGQVRQMVADAAVNGWDEATLKAQIADSFKLPENRAALIANDQIGKLNGQLTRLRQQNIGIKQYRWRGKLDSRERDSHLKREGKIFDWDNPPSGGHPGSEINCRCHAQMILPEMAEIDALFFGDGGNRSYNAQMTQRGLTPETGGAAVYANPFVQYGYLPRGGVSSGSLKQTLEAVAKEAVKVAVQTAAQATHGISNLTVAQSTKSQNLANTMREEWGSFPDVILVNRKTTIAEHSAYQAAKSGDLNQAIELVNDYLYEEVLAEVRNLVEQHHNKVILLPIHAIEESGRNRLPVAYATWLSQYLNLPIDMNIVQADIVGRTGADGFDRLVKSVRFDGQVIPNQKYLLIDDAVTQGGTLADLKGYIESRGGRVIGASVLMGKPHSAKLAVTKSTLGLLRQNLGKDFEVWWIGEFGYDFSKLTESEARYINKQITRTGIDTVRNTIIARRLAAFGKTGA